MTISHKLSLEKRKKKKEIKVSTQFSEVSGLQPVDTQLHFLQITTPAFYCFMCSFI